VTKWRSILRRVGFVLIIVGLIDIALMIYCIATGRAYASSLNLFAVIAGFFLLRGGLRAAQLVAHFASFLFAATVSFVLAAPVLVPFSFLVTLVRVHPLAAAAYLTFVALALFFLRWTSSSAPRSFSNSS
jgi:hypothetical protein